MSKKNESSIINVIEKYPRIFRSLFVRRWTITERTKILDMTLVETRITYEQLRILLLIPIGEKIKVSEETEYFKLSKSSKKILYEIWKKLERIPLPVWIHNCLHNQTKRLTYKSN